MSSFPALPTLPAISPLPSIGNEVNSAAQSSANPAPQTNALNILGAIGAATQNPLGYFATGTGAGNSTSSAFSYGRIAAFVIGLLLIGGGILMFRQTQVVIQAGAKAGKRIGEIAAL